MKVRLVPPLTLVITPDSFVEAVALKAWAEGDKDNILIEAFEVEESPKLSYCPCHLPQVHGHLDERCPEFKPKE